MITFTNKSFLNQLKKSN